MAKVIITDTYKTGWIKIDYNEYYPNSCNHKEQLQLKSDVSAIDIITVGGDECVELMTSQDFSVFFTNNLSSSKFYGIESINGVSPTSITDLRDKLLNLL